MFKNRLMIPLFSKNLNFSNVLHFEYLCDKSIQLAKQIWKAGFLKKMFSKHMFYFFCVNSITFQQINNFNIFI